MKFQVNLHGEADPVPLCQITNYQISINQSKSKPVWCSFFAHQTILMNRYLTKISK